MALLRYLGNVLLSLLPPRYREEDEHLRGYAMVSAILEFFFAVSTLVGRILWLATHPPGPVAGVDAKEMFIVKGGKFVAETVLGGLLDFWVNPVTILTYYFMAEAVVRFMSAFVGRQVIGTLPLYVISAAHNLLNRSAHQKSLGDLVPDEVIRGGEKQGYDLKVYSCRPKLHWNPYMTIEFEGGFYQLFKEEIIEGPRRFTYFLRNNPMGRVVVTIDHYKIDHVMKPVDKWAGTPTTRDKMAKVLDRTKLVPDEIVRGGTSRHNYDLKIYSCREKKEWTPHMMNTLKDLGLHLFREGKAQNPRPLLNSLRINPENRPAGKIRKYKPDDVMKAHG